ncbi:hypothetical protein AN189_12985 [Loktanella sp. 3ANDIMAR09]|nr:hypothetical protein AN189_12985 [Loktanella sp. 3ANDIMAR09]
MTKTNLIDQIAEQTGDTKVDIERHIGAFLDTIWSAMVAGDEVTLRGFGTFKVRDSKARTGRNPRTGEPVEIAAKRTAAFKPSSALSEKMNG